VVLFGTRPEAVKLAPVVSALRARPHEVRLCVAVTGQHREMLDQVLATFYINPDVDLDLSSRWLGRVPSLAEITSSALVAVDDVLSAERPDLVLVQGDTSTAFAGAMAAALRKVPVGHVEAGLRTHHAFDPFPEEMNRRLISGVATMHFAPTASARQNLLREHVAEDAIYVTGNTVIDALRGVVHSGRLDAVTLPIELQWLRTCGLVAGSMSPGRTGRRVVLVTLHRRECWGEPMAGICRALRAVLDDVVDLEIVFPVHRNVIVREVVHSILGGHPRIHLTEPLDYVGFVYALHRCYLVVTDSGGLQEEAPALGKPVLVLRETTERPEGVEAGTARLVGTGERAVYQAVRQLADDQSAYLAMARAVNPYGDGQAAKRITDAILARRQELQLVVQKSP
jgi:UDP-N-acetylglucosamine 2-epimerase (non-hydrolysing)